MNKKCKIVSYGLLIFVAVVLFIIVISFFLKNIIKVNSNDYSSLIGSVLGAIISGIIALIVLFITIKQGNKNQEKALNMQFALQAENNLLQVLEKRKEVIIESVNQLDDLLFTVQILKVSGIEEISEERKNLINLFSAYCKAMNVIKLNTDIYIDTSKCDGCTDCDINAYGELSKMKTKLCECFNKVELNCNLMVQELQVALDECIDAKNLLAQSNLYQKQLLLYEEQIQNYKERAVLDSNDNVVVEKLKQCEAEYTKLQEQLKVIDTQIQTALKDIGERNGKARDKANRIQICDRNELYNVIMKYFNIYSFYIKENKSFVLNNGTLFNTIYKKYTLIKRSFRLYNKL